jgi:hypothetical protein
MIFYDITLCSMEDKFLQNIGNYVCTKPYGVTS